MKLYILTVANTSKYYYPYLVKSVELNNNKLITLGFGKEWKGFNTKFNLMLEELKKYDENDIVCFVDGFDVICTRNLNELKNEFIKIKNRENCKIIVGYDYIPNILIRTIASLYFTKKINTININSGTYIGFVKDILDILKTINNINPEDIADDQILLNKYNEQNPGSIYIDTNFEFFFTIGSPLTNIRKYVKIKDNNVYINNNKPFFIHAAGCGYLDNIIIDLNYDYNDNIKDIIKQNFLNKYISQYTNIIKNYFDKNKYYILFKLIIIFIVIYIFSNTVSITTRP